MGNSIGPVTLIKTPQQLPAFSLRASDLGWQSTTFSLPAGVAILSVSGKMLGSLPAMLAKLAAAEQQLTVGIEFVRRGNR
jgi:hypothetical protein